MAAPLEIIFQEQSNSSLHSAWSLAWDHFRGIIADPFGSSADPFGSSAVTDAAIADGSGTNV